MSIAKDSMKLPGNAGLITRTGETGFDVLIETSQEYLYRGYKTMLIRMTPVFIGVLLLAAIFTSLLSKRLQIRLGILQEKIGAISGWRLNENLCIDGRDEFSLLANRLDETRKRILELIEHENRMHEQNRISEMNALRSQINSHFLFNSLSSIRRLSRSGNSTALVNSVDCLATFLRYALATKEHQVKLDDEIKQL
jgi:two-component system sensor histidine kinase YesM